MNGPLTLGILSVGLLARIMHEEWNSNRVWLKRGTAATSGRIRPDRGIDFKVLSPVEHEFWRAAAHLAPERDKLLWIGKKWKILTALRSETHGDASESELKRKRYRQANENAPYRNHYSCPELEQPFAQRADLGPCTIGPGRPQA